MFTLGKESNPYGSISMSAVTFILINKFIIVFVKYEEL